MNIVQKSKFNLKGVRHELDLPARHTHAAGLLPTCRVLHRGDLNARFVGDSTNNGQEIQLKF